MKSFARFSPKEIQHALVTVYPERFSGVDVKTECVSITSTVERDGTYVMQVEKLQCQHKKEDTHDQAQVAEASTRRA